ncbi:MAG: decaprenyl-phosphate phosphoribosyltransferase [Polyangiaceae bacterium]|nr:decaprenyl-phosphate phosphoribosyltransferase [Polyangiaceae bacterium]
MSPPNPDAIAPSTPSTAIPKDDPESLSAPMASEDFLAPSSAPLTSTSPLVRSSGSLLWRLAGVVRTVRPHQWVKNVFVLAPVVFAKEIFDLALLSRAAAAFAVFCLLAGAVYAMNDLADIEADRQHPVKRYRPIASGRVPASWARMMVWVLVGLSAMGAVGIEVALQSLNETPTFGFFLATTAAYFVNNVAYSSRLKHIAYLDVASIAAGFVLRVMAGGFATNVPVSGYLFVCMAVLALFLGFGKRRHELTAARSNAKHQRAALESYTRRGLDLALWLTAAATITTYIAYTLDPHTREFFRSDWLWPSTLFVVLAMGRFVFLVQSRPKSESPTHEMLKDGPFVLIVVLWAILVMWVVYHLQPGL